MDKKQERLESAVAKMTDSVYRLKIKLRLVRVILLPFIWDKIKEQLVTVIPVCAYLVLFQLLVLLGARTLFYLNAIVGTLLLMRKQIY